MIPERGFGIDVDFPSDIYLGSSVMYFGVGHTTSRGRNSAKSSLSKTDVFKEKNASSLKRFLLYFPR